MDMKKRRDMQLAYISDETVMEEQIKCRKILQKLNFADRSDFECGYLYSRTSDLPGYA